MFFAAEDEVLVFRGDAGEGVVRVDEAPVVEGGAIVLVGPVFGGKRGVKVQPLAFAAVEVLFFSRYFMLTKKKPPNQGFPVNICKDGRLEVGGGFLFLTYPVIIVSDKHFMALCCDLCNGSVALPRLDNDVFS